MRLEGPKKNTVRVPTPHTTPTLLRRRSLAPVFRHVVERRHRLLVRITAERVLKALHLTRALLAHLLLVRRREERHRNLLEPREGGGGGQAGNQLVVVVQHLQRLLVARAHALRDEFHTLGIMRGDRRYSVRIQVHAVVQVAEEEDEARVLWLHQRVHQLART